MTFYKLKGTLSSKVYISLGSIYLVIGKFSGSIGANNSFKIKSYKDYHNVKVTAWEGYSWATKSPKKMEKIKKEDVKKWNIHLHKEMYQPLIALIFMHNPIPKENQ